MRRETQREAAAEGVTYDSDSFDATVIEGEHHAVEYVLEGPQVLPLRESEEVWNDHTHAPAEPSRQRQIGARSHAISVKHED